MSATLLGEAIRFVLTPESLALILLICVIGIILGALPGVGQVLALALFFPFSLLFDSATALMLMAVLFGATTYGASLSAILIRIPGSSTSMATILDGYPLATSGRARFAIGISTVSSFIGAVIGLLTLALVAPRLARFGATLASHELFWLTVIGFATVSAAVQGSIFKSMVAIALGVLVASVGTDPVQGQSRFVFGTLFLQGGLDLVVFMVGMFSIPQVLDMVNKKTISSTGEAGGNMFEGVTEVVSKPIQAVRGSVIGVVIGSIPGVGATAANFISYLTAVNLSSDPESFGKGNPEGVIASETANNASAMGSLVPAMALSIPGSATAAVFIGAMIVHGITPGTQAFTGPLPYIIYVSIFVGAFITLALGLLGAKHFTRVTTIPNDILIACIIVLAFGGGFAVRNNLLDIFVLIGAGLLGFFMMRQGYSIVAFILAYVLTPVSERGFNRALITSGGDYSIFWSTNLSIALIAVAVIVLLAPMMFQFTNQ